MKLHVGLEHGGYLPVFATVDAPHYLKFANELAASLQQLLRLLHLNLFQRRDLLALLHGDARDPPPRCQQNPLVLV